MQTAIRAFDAKAPWRAAVYRGEWTSPSGARVPAVFKYTNDANADVESDVLRYLNRADPALHVPKLCAVQQEACAPDGTPFRRCIVMEDVKGGAPGAPLTYSDPKRLRARLRALRDILQRLHDLDVYHCDVHGDNVICTGDDVFLVDFGQAHSLVDARFKVPATCHLPSLARDNFGVLNLGAPLPGGLPWPAGWQTLPTRDLPL